MKVIGNDFFDRYIFSPQPRVRSELICKVVVSKGNPFTGIFIHFIRKEAPLNDL